MRKLPTLVLALAIAGCGSSDGTAGGGSPTPTETRAACVPSDAQLQVTARELEFDTECLAARAGEAFTILLRNKDAEIQHNIHILGGGAGSIFMGEVFAGVADMAYHVPAIAAGEYLFRCDIHPGMSGTFVAG